MLRHAVAAEPWRPVTLLCSFRGELGVPFEEELAFLSRRHPQVRVAVTLTGEQNSRYLTGRIDGRMVRDYVLDPEHSLFCLCGPAAMIDGLRRELREIGIPDPQVRFEAFEAAIAASKSVAAPAAKALTGPRAPRNGLALRLSLSGKSVCLAPDQTLLDAAEAGGVEIPSLCRAGACGTCKTKLVSGNVDFSSDSLHPEDRKQGYVFPCVATAKSDCTLEL
jgi:ferredoxin-NADP reductase